MITGEKVLASFFALYVKTDISYMKISTDDFFSLARTKDKSSTIYSILNSMSHEIQHYYKWVDDDELDEQIEETAGEELFSEYFEYLKEKK